MQKHLRCTVVVLLKRKSSVSLFKNLIYCKCVQTGLRFLYLYLFFVMMSNEE